jgi:polar amino acid transport system permease protein
MTTHTCDNRNRVRSSADRSTVIDLFKFALTVFILGWALLIATQRIEYNWQWYRIPKYLFTIEDHTILAGPLIRGLWITLEIAGWSLILSVAFGLSAALLRLSQSFIGHWVARIYVEVVRNTPLLVQLFFLYFVVAPIFGLSRFQSAVLALSLFEGAYASEIFRAGILSIHRGQWEAAYSLGLNAWATYLTVILPQAIRRVLPPLTSQGISLIKDSALVSAIAVYDLTMEGRTIISETFLTFEVWFTIAAVYLAITISLSFLVRLMEKKFKMRT